MIHVTRSLLVMLGLLGVIGFGKPSRAAEPSDRPKAAFFPLGGPADAKLRDKVGFSLRAKLDRDGHYEVIDGPKMKDIAAESKNPVTFDTPATDVIEMAKLVDATIIAWGDLDQRNALRLKVLDLRQAGTQPREFTKAIAQPTDLRFVSEQILESIAGVAKFEHPVEQAVWDDAKATELWAKNPNLVLNGDFSAPGKWFGIYMSEYYPVTISDALPATDKVCIYRLKEPGQPANNVLAMNLSKECAENNGMACLSEPFPIEPNTRYRIQFRYKSDGPVLHVFVKGYTSGEDIKGQKADREVYRRQVPVSGETHGKWVTVVDDMNPQNITWPVERLKVDLYAYLKPGIVMFDDVVVKAVGAQTRHARDDAIKLPVSRPASTK